MNTINKTNNRIPSELIEPFTKLYDRRKLFRRVIGGSLGTFAVGLGGMGVAEHTLAQRRERLKNEKDKSYTTRESIAAGGGLVSGWLTAGSLGFLANAIFHYIGIGKEIKDGEEYLGISQAANSGSEI